MLRYVLRRWGEDRCPQIAGSLTFMLGAYATLGNEAVAAAAAVMAFPSRLKAVTPPPADLGGDRFAVTRRRRDMHPDHEAAHLVTARGMGSGLRRRGAGARSVAAADE